MQGSLRQVPLPEVLQFISMGKSSGVLGLRRGNSEITLYINSGRIINSSSIERRRRLGDLLVHRGLLKRSELSQLLNLQKTVESDKRLGQILVERDIVSEDTIRETLRLQLEEEIWSLFTWDEGEFRFEGVEDTARLGDPIVQIEIEPLILEGTRRNDEWRKIQSVIPDDRIVLTVAGVSDDFERDLKLHPQEWRVLSQVNGRFTIRAIVNRSNLGRFEVHRILTQFMKSGLLVPKEEEEVETGAHPALKEEDVQAARQEKGRGLLDGLLGKSKPERVNVHENLGFVSPIGVLAYFTTQVARRMKELKEYTASGDDSRLLQIVWNDLVQTYTKADLIEVKGNVIDHRGIEACFAACEFSEAVDECYEDALEGLMNLLQIAFRVFAQRAGERAASRVVRDLLDEMAAATTVRFRGPFPLVERVQNVLKLAA
ncbi:DUF4388 domain-containing protein [Candidatus Poribacteria bacterium]|nr:DUF4388 domain-containing protein [Candidatus Poribacteria bacterium]